MLHLLAIAREAGVELTLDDFDAASRRVPHIVDMRPGGRFVMADLDRVGGLPVVLRELLEAGLVDGDTMTVTGRTLAENLEGAGKPDGEVVRPVATPIAREGGLAVLRGNLAPDGALVKPAAASPHLLRHRGRAVVFDSIEDFNARIDDPNNKVTVTHVVFEGLDGHRSVATIEDALNDDEKHRHHQERQDHHGDRPDNYPFHVSSSSARMRSRPCASRLEISWIGSRVEPSGLRPSRSSSWTTTRSILSARSGLWIRSWSRCARQLAGSAADAAGSASAQVCGTVTGTKTVNGSVEVSLPGDTRADLDISTVNGSINTEFPITVTGRWGPKNARGTVNGGGEALLPPARLRQVERRAELREVLQPLVRAEGAGAHGHRARLA